MERSKSIYSGEQLEWLQDRSSPEFCWFMELTRRLNEALDAKDRPAADHWHRLRVQFFRDTLNA